MEDRGGSEAGVSRRRAEGRSRGRALSGPGRNGDTLLNSKSVQGRAESAVHRQLGYAEFSRSQAAATHRDRWNSGPGQGLGQGLAQDQGEEPYEGSAQVLGEDLGQE